MTAKKRISAFALAFTLVFVMLSSLLYITTSSHHDCIGENCEVCTQISNCENNLRNITCTVKSASYTAAVICSAVVLLLLFAEVCGSSTLVSLKTKLSN